MNGLPIKRCCRMSLLKSKFNQEILVNSSAPHKLSHVEFTL